MDRITVKHADKWIIPKSRLPEAARKLAGYEDTGLDPDQIYEMDRLYSEKCADVGNLNLRLAYYKEKLEAEKE